MARFLSHVSRTRCPTQAGASYQKRLWSSAADQPARINQRYPIGGGDLAEVHTLALQGQKIQAIKLYRELTGAGLKEAKDYVDSL